MLTNNTNFYNKHFFNSFKYKNKYSLNVNNNNFFSICQLNNNDNKDINNNKNDDDDNNNNNNNFFKNMINLSSKKFNPSVLSLLNKGLNLALAPSRIPTDDIICNIEFGMKDLPNIIKETIR